MSTSREISSNIREANLRAAEVIQKKPATGRLAKRTTARVIEGLVVEMQEGDWVLRADQPEVFGGSNSAPTPGVLCRMGITSCLVHGYAIWLSREGIPYEDIRVELEGDVDARGFLGLDESIPPGHESLRITAHVTSPAPREDIERVLNHAHTKSPMMHLATNVVRVSCDLEVRPPGIARESESASAATLG